MMTRAGGFTPAYADLFSWTLSFLSATSFQVCLFRTVTPMVWGDRTLKFKWSYTTTPCALGQYINATYLCAACPAGSFGSFAPLSSSACSGLCSAGMRAFRYVCHSTFICSPSLLNHEFPCMHACEY